MTYPSSTSHDVENEDKYGGDVTNTATATTDQDSQQHGAGVGGAAIGILGNALGGSGANLQKAEQGAITGASNFGIGGPVQDNTVNVS